MKVIKYRLKPGLRHTGHIGGKKVFYTGGDFVPLSAGAVKSFGDKFDAITLDIPDEVKDEKPPTSSDGSRNESIDNEEDTDEGETDGDSDDTEENEQEGEEEEEVDNEETEVTLEAVNRKRGRWIVQTPDGYKQHKRYVTKERAEKWVRTGTDPGE